MRTMTKQELMTIIDEVEHDIYDAHCEGDYAEVERLEKNIETYSRMLGGM